MQNSSLSERQLIVVELGAEWPRAVLEVAAGTRRVLAQDDSESPAAFAVRVGAQLNGQEGRVLALTSAVIACNERLDQQAHDARSELARAAASALARNRGGELLLVAADSKDGRSRSAHSVLLSALLNDWQSAGVIAKLRLVDGNGEVESDTTTAEAKSRTRSSRAANKAGARRVA